MVEVGKFVLNVLVPVIPFAPLNEAYDVNAVFLNVIVSIPVVAVVIALST